VAENAESGLRIAECDWRRDLEIQNILGNPQSGFRIFCHLCR
jgi:hypothetical protein